MKNILIIIFIITNAICMAFCSLIGATRHKAVLFSVLVSIIIVLISYGIGYLMSIAVKNKHLLIDKNNIKKISFLLIGILTAYIIFRIITLPIGLHFSAKIMYGETVYVYKNYLGVTVINGVCDIIGQRNDTVGDFDHCPSPIYQAYGFRNDEASVWLLYSRLDENNILYMPACINNMGEILHYGYCDMLQESDDSYARGIFEYEGFPFSNDKPLWQQYDNYFEYVNNPSDYLQDYMLKLP